MNNDISNKQLEEDIKQALSSSGKKIMDLRTAVYIVIASFGAITSLVGLSMAAGEFRGDIKDNKIAITDERMDREKADEEIKNLIRETKREIHEDITRLRSSVKDNHKEIIDLLKK